MKKNSSKKRGKQSQSPLKRQRRSPKKSARKSSTKKSTEPPKKKRGSNRTKKGETPEQLKPYLWRKGDPSPNPKGRPSYSLTRILRQALKHKSKRKGIETVGEELVKAAIENAKKGSHKFFTEIINRMDGKVPDKIIGGIGTSPLTDLNDADLQKIIDAGGSEAEETDGD